MTPYIIIISVISFAILACSAFLIIAKKSKSRIDHLEESLRKLQKALREEKDNENN